MSFFSVFVPIVIMRVLALQMAELGQVMSAAVLVIIHPNKATAH